MTAKPHYFVPKNSGTIGIVAANSVDYVQSVFDALRSEQTFVTLRSRTDVQRISEAGVSRVVEPNRAHGLIRDRFQLKDEDTLCQIAFTSGTEGPPKGVLLTRSNLCNANFRLVDAMKLDQSIREYVGVPVYHSFGFGRIRAIAAVGGQSYIPRNGFDVAEIATLLRANKVNAISAVPSLWRVLLQQRHLLSKFGARVKWIEIGSQYMSAAEKAELRSLFPAATIVQHYGLTEASRSTFLSISDCDFSELESVGSPNGDVELRISPDGRIEIRGGHVARELLVSGERVPNTDSHGWLSTGDLGELKNSLLFYRCRADDILNIAGIKIAPHLIEQDIRDKLSLAEECAVARIPDFLLGDGLLVAVKQSDLQLSDEIIQVVRSSLLALGATAGARIEVIAVQEFPTTFNGKVQRSLLSDICKEQSGADSPLGIEQQQPSTEDESVLAAFTRFFPRQKIQETDSFSLLGGDSLKFAEFTIMLERKLGFLPKNWQHKTISQLSRIKPRHTRWRSIDTTLLIRAVGITAIVIGHFTSLPVTGAAFLLLVTAGFNFSRFQLPKVLSTGNALPVLRSALHLAAPLWLVSGAIQLRHGELDIHSTFLIGNWRDQATAPIDFWFIEALIQVLLIVALLFSVRPALRACKHHPIAFSALALAIAVGLEQFLPMLWDSTHLYNRVPHMLGWMFCLGWLMHSLGTGPRRITAIPLIVILPVLIWSWDLSALPFWIGYAPIWIAAGGAILQAMPEISLVSGIYNIAYQLGGASMFIYLSHYPLAGILLRFFPSMHPFLLVLICLAFGVIFWKAWSTCMNKLRQWLSLVRINANGEYPRN